MEQETSIFIRDWFYEELKDSSQKYYQASSSLYRTKKKRKTCYFNSYRATLWLQFK